VPKKVLIYGSGEEAQLVVAMLKQRRYKKRFVVVGYKDDARRVFTLNGLPVRKSLSEFDFDHLILAITNKATMRLQDLAALSEFVVTPIPVIDQTARISANAITTQSVIIHKRVTIDHGTYLADFVIVKDDTKIGERVTVGEYTTIGCGCEIKDGVKIGRGCTIGDHVTLDAWIKIGNRVRVTDGSLLTSDAKNDGLYTGRPAMHAGVSKK